MIRTTYFDSLIELISQMLSDLSVMTIFWSFTAQFRRNVQVKRIKETYAIYRKIIKANDIMNNHEEIKNMMQNWLIIKCLIDLQPIRVTHVTL
jgi:hypothetical protein